MQAGFGLLEMPPFDADVIIVGGGPAGLSTALHLVQMDTKWAGRILLLEKAHYPREKLCGGGITLPGLEILAGLGLKLDASHTPVHEVRLHYRQHLYLLRSEPAFVVVRRSEFDQWLAQQARASGVRIMEGAGVTDVSVGDDVRVRTNARTYRAPVLVTADGSNSTVRRLLRWGSGHKARLLEILTPADAQSEAFTRGVARFDWTPMDAGLQGYYWEFPSLVAGRAMMNRGVFDSRLYVKTPKPDLRSILAQMLAKRGLRLEDYQLKGHPIHWWTPGSQLARHRVLLAGDAAGADPLLGEGIAFALGYGQVAARAVVAAFTDDDFSFADYHERVRNHWLTRQLRARHLGARIAFGSLRWQPLAHALWIGAPWLFRALVALRPDYFPLTEQRMRRL